MFVADAIGYGTEKPVRLQQILGICGGPSGGPRNFLDVSWTLTVDVISGETKRAPSTRVTGLDDHAVSDLHASRLSNLNHFARRFMAEAISLATCLEGFVLGAHRDGVDFDQRKVLDRLWLCPIHNTCIALAENGGCFHCRTLLDAERAIETTIQHSVLSAEFSEKCTTEAGGIYSTHRDHAYR